MRRVVFLLMLVGSFLMAQGNQSSSKEGGVLPVTPVDKDEIIFDEMEKFFEYQMRQMKRMEEEMNKMFRAFEQNFNISSFKRAPILINSRGIMSSGIVDKKDHYEIFIRVMDVNNSKISVNTQDNILTIKVSQESKKEQNKGKYGKIISFSAQNFVQSFTLPPDANPKEIDIKKAKDGVIVIIKKKNGLEKHLLNKN